MSWAEEELGSADLGDARVSRRLVRLAEDLSANPTASIPQACQGWAETKAAYRFFAREELDWRAILQPHWERTAERMRACPRVLCPQASRGAGFHHLSRASRDWDALSLRANTGCSFIRRWRSPLKA